MYFMYFVYHLINSFLFLQSFQKLNILELSQYLYDSTTTLIIKIYKKL